MGITTPGNKTVFLRGRIGTESGKSSLLNASSSSVVNNGINSDSASISLSDKLSNEMKFDLAIFIILGHCVIIKGIIEGFSRLQFAFDPI